MLELVIVGQQDDQWSAFAYVLRDAFHIVTVCAGLKQKGVELVLAKLLTEILATESLLLFCLLIQCNAVGIA